MNLIKWSTIVFSVFTLLLTIVFFTWWAMKDQAVFGSEKFDQQKWAESAATVETDCKRGDMAYHLQQKILSPGVQRAAVTALLGRPSYEDERAMEYDLGKCMHVYHGLLIYFDENGRLLHSKISSH